MDKSDRLVMWMDAVRALYTATVAVDRAGEGLSDSDILGAGLTREDRARLSVWLGEIDAWAQTNTQRVTLPALLLGANLLEFEQVERLQQVSDEDVLLDAEAIIRQSASSDGP